MGSRFEYYQVCLPQPTTIPTRSTRFDENDQNNSIFQLYCQLLNANEEQQPEETRLRNEVIKKVAMLGWMPSQELWNKHSIRRLQDQDVLLEGQGLRRDDPRNVAFVNEQLWVHDPAKAHRWLQTGISAGMVIAIGRPIAEGFVVQSVLLRRGNRDDNRVGTPAGSPSNLVLV